MADRPGRERGDRRRPRNGYQGATKAQAPSRDDHCRAGCGKKKITEIKAILADEVDQALTVLAEDLGRRLN